MISSDSFKRLDNGQFELVVSAATGRIIRYGAVNGSNVLWENPQAATTPSPFAGWINWGGDKVWIWPEDDWTKWQGGVLAPPGDPPSHAYQLEVSELSMSLISPVIPAYGLRIVREISLAPRGSGVTLVNRLEQVAAGESANGSKPLPVGVWTVTQIPAARQILARLLPGISGPRHEPFRKSPWKDVKIVNEFAMLTRPPSPWVKIGLEADVLAIPVGQQLFVVRHPADKNAGDGHQPCRRAQVFSDPDLSEFRPAEVAPYVEFEFTSPLKSLAVGESVSLTLTWELHPQAKNGEDITRLIKGDDAVDVGKNDLN